MVTRKTWKEFQDTGLLWWINMILHTFGWSIVMNIDNDEITDVYPARVKYRGFSEKINDEGYAKIAKYIKENASFILDECDNND